MSVPQPQPKTHVTAEEYLAFDREAEYRHEHIEGEIVAMSGGTRAHSLIASNVNSELHSALRVRTCFVFTSDMRVKAGDDFCYPDVSVACGGSVVEGPGEDILIDPVVIVEVLSDSTEAYDRGKKFASYQRIPTLVHYVLVSQHDVRVEHFRRVSGATPDNEWLLQVLGRGQVLELGALECRIAIDAFYRGVFDTP